VRWQIVSAIFAMAAVSYLDRSNIAVAAAAIQKTFALTDLELGWVFSAFVAGYALAQPIAGRIADHVGPSRLVAIGIAWWTLFTVATALVPRGWPSSLGILIAVRFLLGLGEAVIFPAGNRLVANWIPPSERGLANGIIFAGVGIGAGVAPPLITSILIARDWHWAFYASALIGLFALGVWLLLVRDRPDQVARMSEHELAYIRAGGVTLADAPPLSWRRIARNPTMVLLGLSYFTYGYVAYIFFTWFFKYLSAVRGLDLKSSAFYAVLPFLAMAIASPVGGWASDRLSARFGPRTGRCRMAAVAMTLAALFVATATQIGDARLASLFLAGGSGALYLSQSAFWTISADLGGRSAGSVSGLMNMCNQIGGVITASLTPVLASRFGWTMSFCFAAFLCLVGGVLWLLIDPAAQLQVLADPKRRIAIDR
jgi:ACS family glucarate transporter-like MFS transporter